jgi:hypothetical protein
MIVSTELRIRNSDTPEKKQAVFHPVEAFWLHGYSPQQCSSSQYQGVVKSTVDAFTSLKLMLS